MCTSIKRFKTCWMKARKKRKHFWLISFKAKKRLLKWKGHLWWHPKAAQHKQLLASGAYCRNAFTFTWPMYPFTMNNDMLGEKLYTYYKKWFDLWGSSAICTYLRLGLFDLRHQKSVHACIFHFKEQQHIQDMFRQQNSLAHCFVFVRKKDHMLPCKEPSHRKIVILSQRFWETAENREVVNLQSKAGADGKKVAPTLCVDWSNDSGILTLVPA